jgi:dipeptidyl aminopeptidase/acylaminoacyl peptidase
MASSFGLASGSRLLAIAFAMLAVMAGARSATAQVLDERACEPAPDYGKVAAGWTKDQSGYGGWLTSARYEDIATKWECRRIVYRSDGLRVTGFIYRPREGAVRRPAIIVNRGGTGDFGMMHPWLQSYYLAYLDAGYVLVMPQYRGTDGGEGADEYGGADLADVTSLVPIARSLPYVDSENVFMLGFSRGGLMTYLALSLGLPIRAAATVSGLTNLARQIRYRPEMREEVFRKLIPDFATREAEHYRLRSAVEWPERIDTPLLLVHGNADDRVKAEDALELATKLQALGRRFELLVFDGDGHGVPAHKLETDRRVIAWFEKHRR